MCWEIQRMRCPKCGRLNHMSQNLCVECDSDLTAPFRMSPHHLATCGLFCLWFSGLAWFTMTYTDLTRLRGNAGIMLFLYLLLGRWPSVIALGSLGAAFLLRA